MVQYDMSQRFNHFLFLIIVGHPKDIALCFLYISEYIKTNKIFTLAVSIYRNCNEEFFSKLGTLLS